MAEMKLPLRKRHRLAFSCVECRRRKIKCDRTDPCNHCKQSRGITCVYSASGRASTAKSSASSAASTSLLRAPDQRQVIDSPSPTQEHNVFSSGYSSSPNTVDSVNSERGRGTTLWTQTSHNITPNQNLTHSPDRNRQIRKESSNSIAMDVPDNETFEDNVNEEATGVNFLASNNVIVEHGNIKGVLRTKITKTNHETSLHESRENISKMLYYGPSNWKHSLRQFESIVTPETLNFMSGRSGDGAASAIRHVRYRCKAMARRNKAELLSLCASKTHICDDFPEREVADQLVQHYFRTMENTYRILHIPSFYQEYEEYWRDPKQSPPSLVVKILLVMAIGACFYQNEDADSLRARAKAWVYAAQAWVSSPLDKGRLNLSGLQVQCLLILARQINSVGVDLVWIAAGTLLRTAFLMGLHRDPRFFPKMSTMQGELCRRLWTTVLEMTIQTSLASGMPLLITMNDFDTKPPLNINDEDLCESATTAPTPKPPHIFTQTSIQIQLWNSLPIRYQILRQVNDLQSDTSYDDVLRLGTKITAACNEATLRINKYDSPHQPTMLQRNLFDLILRRFILAVHWAFAVKSKRDPRFYFSYKVCLSTALIITSHTGSLPTDVPPLPGHTDDYTRLKLVAGGFYKEVILYAGVIVCLELHRQLEEDMVSGLLPSFSALTYAPLQKIMQDIVALSEARVALGDNSKEYIFLSAAMARIKALEEGTDAEQAMKDVALQSARHYLELVIARTSPLETLSDTGGLQGVEGKLTEELPMMDQAFPYDFMLQDGCSYSDADMPDSWLFGSWNDTYL